MNEWSIQTLCNERINVCSKSHCSISAGLYLCEIICYANIINSQICVILMTRTCLLGCMQCILLCANMYIMSTIFLSIDQYDVALNGPIGAVVVQSKVHLYCDAITDHHLPMVMRISKNVSLVYKYSDSFEHTVLPNGKKRKRIEYLIENATHSDAGTYVCEVTWYNPHVFRNSSYDLDIRCK